MTMREGREWVQVNGWGPGARAGVRGVPSSQKGWIPRDALEAMGVDCSPLDRDPQGTIWFSKDQAAAIKLHTEWEPEAGGEVTDGD